MRSIVALALLSLTPVACGDDGGGAPDGGSRLNRLKIQSPPGEQLGLPFAGAATLRVAYLDPDDHPIRGAEVDFTLVAQASESTGGATLSAERATTDELGVARVDLVAGAERTTFRVQVTAADAPPALFYVAVSASGFTTLAITPGHEGFRDPTGFASVQVRLYRALDLACADLVVDAPPESLFPPRALGFGDAAGYQNLLAGEGYTVVAWAVRVPDGLRLAIGCVDLGGAAVRPGELVALSLPVRDRALTLPPALALHSSFDARPLAAAVAAAAPDPWAVLHCPLGAAQLLLDCALDAHAPDGRADCVVGGSDPLVGEIDALRGPPDADGCRPATVLGRPSLDAELAAAVNSPWAGADLGSLLAAHDAPLTDFSLDSRLVLDGPAARHELASATIGDVAVDLVASPRPIVSASGIPWAIDSAFVLGPHGFTLRYGQLAFATFDQAGLGPLGLSARAQDLGGALAAAFGQGGVVGCDRLSATACAAASRPATCLVAACQAALTPLDLALDRWWRVLDAAGIDVTLTAAATPRDDDGDLVLEALGGDGAPAWTAVLELASGNATLSGTLAGTPAP